MPIEKFLKKHQNKIEKFFEDEIQTILTPITVDSTHPLPFIPNLCLSLIAKIKHKKTKKAFISVVRISDLKQRFLKIKENLAVKIIEIVEKNEAGFAFPSQSLYVEKLSDEKTEIFNPQSRKN